MGSCVSGGSKEEFCKGRLLGKGERDTEWYQVDVNRPGFGNRQSLALKQQPWRCILDELQSPNIELITERNLLMYVGLGCEFLVNMHFAFNDVTLREARLVQDLCEGGDMKYQLKLCKGTRLPERSAMFYVRCVIRTSYLEAVSDSLTKPSHCRLPKFA